MTPIKQLGLAVIVGIIVATLVILTLNWTPEIIEPKVEEVRKYPLIIRGTIDGKPIKLVIEGYHLREVVR